MDHRWLVLIASAALAACSPGPSRVCTPGQSFQCSCVSGALGAQTCLPDGTGFGACACNDVDSGLPHFVDSGITAPDAFDPCSVAAGSWAFTYALVSGSCTAQAPTTYTGLGPGVDSIVGRLALCDAFPCTRTLCAASTPGSAESMNPSGVEVDRRVSLSATDTTHVTGTLTSMYMAGGTCVSQITGTYIGP